jgi:hypothetical protein
LTGGVRNTEWVSVATAAQLMGVCKRQALRRLRQLDRELGGRLLRSLGRKHMPDGVQASKYLVCTRVLLEALRTAPHDVERDIQTLRLEQALIAQRVEVLRRLVRPLVRRGGAENGT